jgi:hypothetical protein
MEIHARRRVPLSLALLASFAATACDDPADLTLAPIGSGTISGIPFTVTAGTVLQAEPDGPLYADDSGGTLVLDETPAQLGMTDGDLLQLRTRFALSNGGSIQLAAFGNQASLFSTGLSVVLRRVDVDIDYELRLAGTPFADGAFSPPPTVFYADSVPGYGADQWGLATWQLDDLTPGAGEDVLGCDPGPALGAAAPTGDRVGYSFAGGWLLAVEVVDQIVGPCS